MTFQQELKSWNPFSWVSNVQSVPEIGSKAPATTKLELPRVDGKPVIVSFLRHCGCPCMSEFSYLLITGESAVLTLQTVAEKIFLKLRQTADENPSVHCVAISHSDQNATNKWLEAVGGSGSVELIVDDAREVFAKYGLGLSSFWAVLNPWSLSAAMNIGKEEGFQIRPTESGSRWQTAGLFAVDSNGVVKYSHPAKTSDDLGDVKEAVNSLSSS